MTIRNKTNDERKPAPISEIERLQLIDFLATKVGILKMKIANGSLTHDDAVSLVQLFNEYEQIGTSLAELKAFEDDIEIALDE